MRGTVTAGKKEGKKFILIEEYKNQFVKKLHLKPYPGTLNLAVNEKIIGDLKKIDGIVLDGFVKNGIRYGMVKCFPAEIYGEKCFVLLPEKSVHKNILEIVAEENLRKRYNLKNGDAVKISFLPFIKICCKYRTYASPYIGKKTSKITVFYDSPFIEGRRDLCYFYDSGMSNQYKKSFCQREVASVLFYTDIKSSYNRLNRFIKEKGYSIMSPVRKIRYSILSEWQIEVRTKEN